MKKIYLLLTLFTTHLDGHSQTPVQLSLIFCSEPQNQMASRIPDLLIEAFRNGDIQAYYPARPNVPLSYSQFLNHFGAKDKAQQMLASNPPWFCEDSENPVLDSYKQECLGKKIELGEKLVENRVTMMNELQLEFVRLIYDNECDPKGIDSYGPLFRVVDIEKLTASKYQIQNPVNPSVNYRLIDLLRLRLFAARKK